MHIVTRHTLQAALCGVVLLMMALGSAFISYGCLAYVEEGEMHPFILEKLPLPNEQMWTTALYIHITAAALSFPTMLLLMSRALLRRVPRLHRWLGRLVGLVVLTALTPAGFYLAFFAKGGAVSTAGFLLTGAIVAVAMLRAVAAARRRDFHTHRRFMLHVLAQMSVAVTSRAVLVLFDVVGVDPERGYVIALWIPVIVSALVAERWAARGASPTTSRRNHESAPVHPWKFDPAG